MASNLEDVCGLARTLWESVHAPLTEEIPLPVSVEKTLIPQVAKLKSAPGKPFAITTHRKAWGNEKFMGLLLRYPEEAQILYSVNLNVCWTRFVICKEVAHLLIDTEKKHYTYDRPEGNRRGLRSRC